MGEGQRTVCFVGLGPGDPGLVTERARARIAAADAVVHDGEASAEALVDLARQGKRVVRVVAGDALESPRVMAEAEAVVEAGFAIEVVPGVGARASAAAFGGVVGRALRVSPAEVAWAVSGEPPDAPVTLLASAGMPLQRVVVTTAGQAQAQVRALGADPVIVAFGEPRAALRWFERRPLFGKRVLVTRAREQAGSTAELLRERGAEPLVVPTIEIHPPADPAPLARAMGELRGGAYAWAVFTSANGVERTWSALQAAGGDARAFGAARLAAIGPATARALEGHGLAADVVAKEFRGEGLADAILVAMRSSGPRLPRVLLARAAQARDVLPESLRAAGCSVDEVAAYETRPPARETAVQLIRDLELGRVDAVLFTSSSTVQNLCDLLGGEAERLLARARIASIGPVTTATAVERRLRVDVTAAEYTVPGLLRALEESWEKPSGAPRPDPVA
jgi:uroporphyrinogen III methyltransferase/synthase